MSLTRRDVAPVSRVVQGPKGWSLLLGTVALTGFGGWAQRWMSDDGFIYLRVVEQIWAGNGPVFNAGERVEAATGPLWLWMLVAVRVIRGIPLEWWAVILGLLLAMLGVGLASAAGQRAGGSWRGGLGVLVFASLPFTWHFTTSGLESGLAFAWVGASALVLISAPDRVDDRRANTMGGLIIGLGPLVRPDFALISGVLLISFVSLDPLRRPAHPHAFWIAAVLPATGYQIFRMAYYRAVLPNSAIAKEAGLANWPQGIRYLADALVNPATLAIVLVGLSALFLRNRNRPLVVLAIAATLYSAAVVRGGGDFMRYRLLLPAILLLAIAGASSASWRRHVVLALLPLAVVIGHYEGARYQTGVSPWIHNERTLYPLLSNDSNPVTLDAFTHSDLVPTGRRARALAASGQSFLIDRTLENTIDLNPSAFRPQAVISGPVGMVGFAAGPEVWIVDRYSLTDPIGARLELTARGRPGHEKVQPREWILASLGFDAGGAVPAHVVRSCGRIEQLLRGLHAPLTADQVWDNILHALSDTTLRIPRAAQEAEEALCR